MLRWARSGYLWCRFCCPLTGDAFSRPGEILPTRNLDLARAGRAGPCWVAGPRPGSLHLPRIQTPRQSIRNPLNMAAVSGAGVCTGCSPRPASRPRGRPANSGRAALRKDRPATRLEMVLISTLVWACRVRMCAQSRATATCPLRASRPPPPPKKTRWDWRASARRPARGAAHIPRISQQA